MFLKLISVIDANLKKQFNQNSLSYGNSLRILINSNASEDSEENGDEFSETTGLENDTALSMSFGNTINLICLKFYTN